MKKILSLLMAFVLVLSVAGCGNQSTSNENTTTTEQADDQSKQQETKETKETERKVLNLIETSNITTLVPWLATDNTSATIIQNVNSALFVYDETGNVKKELVEDYEVSEDGLNYTFHLRDAKWVTANGEEYAPVTANDFVFAIKKLLDPKEAAQYSFMVETAGIKNGKESVALSSRIVKYENNKKNLESMKEEDFKDNENETAKEQFEAAKAKLETSIKEAEEDFNKNYGSLDKAKEEVYQLIDSIGVVAEDDKTLKIELSNPVPYLTSLLTFYSFFPACQKFVEEKGEKYGSSVDNFLYNGPFIFKEWKVSARHYLEKNPAYWDAENVKLDAIDFRVIEGVDNDTLVNMYLNGEIAGAGLAGNNVEKYGNRPDVVALQDVTMAYVEINQGKGELTGNKTLLANPKARKALNMAVDKKYITETILANGSIPADYIVPLGLQKSEDFEGKDFREVAGEINQGEEGYNQYNVEEAKKLWEEAKAETGVQNAQLEFIIFQGESSANIGTHLKNEWEKNLEGLTIILKPLPFSEKIARANKGEFELNFALWGADYADALTFLNLWVSDGGHNATGYANKDYDEVIESATSGALTAPDKSKERFTQLVNLEKKLLEDDQVIIPLFQRARISLRDPNVKNWHSQSFGAQYIFKWVDIEGE